MVLCVDSRKAWFAAGGRKFFHTRKEALAYAEKIELRAAVHEAKTRQMRKVTPELVELIKSRALTESLGAIGADLGISYYFISKILAAGGIPQQPKTETASEPGKIGSGESTDEQQTSTT